jgi:hypothetical protein
LDQGDCNYNVYLDHIIKQKVHPWQNNVKTPRLISFVTGEYFVR